MTKEVQQVVTSIQNLKSFDSASSFDQKFAEAGSLEELFKATAGVTSDQLVGKHLRIQSVEWAEYEVEDKVRELAQVTAMDLMTGEVIEFASTSGAIVKFLWRAEELGQFPFDCQIVQKVTKNGQKALNFAPIK
jgi:hypothetical protein